MTWPMLIVATYFMAVALIYASYVQLPDDQQPEGGPALVAATLPFVFVVVLVALVVLAPFVLVGELIFNRGSQA